MRRLLDRSRVPQWVADFLDQWPALFPPGDDTVWQDWVDFRKRGDRDLIALLEGNSRPSLKARALFILLVPAQAWNPFHWGDDFRFMENYLRSRSDWAGEVPEGLLPFYAQLVIAFCDALAGYNPYGGAQGDVREPGQAYAHLNRHLLGLLGRAPEAMRPWLFERFQLNDPVVLAGPEDASGYNPFAELLRNPEVDERWKRRADYRLRAIILAELRGEAQPRAKHEAALGCYLHALRRAMYDDQLPYSRDLYAGQIEFLVSLSQTNAIHFDASQVDTILQLLRGPQYRELRLNFARLVILKEHSGLGEFVVRDQATLQAATMMQEEFAGVDEALAARLASLIEAGQARLAEDAEQRQRAEQAERALLARMR